MSKNKRPWIFIAIFLLTTTCPSIYTFISSTLVFIIPLHINIATYILYSLWQIINIRNLLQLELGSWCKYFPMIYISSWLNLGSWNRECHAMRFDILSFVELCVTIYRALWYIIFKENNNQSSTFIWPAGRDPARCNKREKV